MSENTKFVNNFSSNGSNLHNFAEIVAAIRLNVPAELQDLAQWVVWKFEQRPGEKKPTKVPYNAKTGAMARSNDPRTWGTFDDAGRAYKRGGYDGIGFVVTKHDPYVGVDLDGCIVNGEFTDNANRWLLALNSYTEITPSNVGVRVWIKGAKPKGEKDESKSKKSKLGVEIYETGRFFTVTGNRLVDLPATINDRQNELEALYNEVFPAPAQPSTVDRPAPSTASLSMDDQQLIERMCRNHDVQTLWDGSLSAHNDDHSSADLALCSHLAFWTGCDPDRMNRIFKQSGLYRPKWDREDYSRRTIDKAISGCSQTYDPNYRSNEQETNTEASSPAMQQNAPVLTQSASGQAQARKKARGKAAPGSSADILNALNDHGYFFRMSELDDSIEVNQQPLCDGVAAEIRCKMRDDGFVGMGAIEDAYTMNAYHNRYHPIKDFLGALAWDGEDHISRLAGYITVADKPIFYADGSKATVIHAFLKRWLIGAVARVYEQAQNVTLTFAGPQGIGKSFIPHWLCSPMDKFFMEGQLDPDGKETDRRLANTWIWEIGELGATTRRADVNALKNKLTQSHVTFRAPYGHNDSTKPVLTSFIGTVNPDGRGFLVDKTGNRRFAVINITDIDQQYSSEIEPSQVWAQAVALYRSGESWRLTSEETATQSSINAEHQAEETIDMVMPQLFFTDVSDDSLQLSPIAIAQELLLRNYAKDLDKCSKDAAAWLKSHGHTKRGKPPTWRGIRLRQPSDPW